MWPVLMAVLLWLGVRAVSGSPRRATAVVYWVRERVRRKVKPSTAKERA